MLAVHVSGTLAATDYEHFVPELTLLRRASGWQRCRFGRGPTRPTRGRDDVQAAVTLRRNTGLSVFTMMQPRSEIVTSF